LVLSAAGALFFRVSDGEIATAFFLLIMGSFIHFVAKGVLIRNEVLCRDGVYSIVRHPYYLANFLVDSSFCVLSGSHYLVLAYPFLFFWSYGPTLRSEERTLEERHPGPFAAHAHDTPPVFPDRLSIRRIGSFFTGFSFKRISAKERARIVRFWAMAILILVIGRLSAEGPFGIGLFHWPFIDILLAVVVLLYAGSAVILKIGKDRAGKT
jgi:hypothetical protein